MALSSLLAGDAEQSLRFAASHLIGEPTSLPGLFLTGKLLLEAGRDADGKSTLSLCVARSIDASNLPIALAAALSLSKAGDSKALDRIAEAFCRESTRLGEAPALPVPMPAKPSPLDASLTGKALLDRAAEIARGAQRSLEAEGKGKPAPKLRRAQLFSALGKAALRRMLEKFRVDIVPRHTRVIEQGTEGTSTYVLARGSLEVVRDQAGTPVSLARLSPGALFGEMALLSRTPRAASVIAARPSIVLCINKEALDEAASREPELGRELAYFCRDRMVQNLLRINGVLAAISPEERPALVAHFAPRAYEQGEALIKQGEPPVGLWLIASGEVEVVRRDNDELFVLANLGVGDTLGELSLILRRPSNADVLAVHPTVTLFLSKDGFTNIIRKHPVLLAELYDLAVKRDEETISLAAQETLQPDDSDIVLL